MNKTFLSNTVVGLFLLTSLIYSNHTIADEQKSVSMGVLSKNLNSDLRLTIAKEHNTATIVDQHIGKATGKTRAEIIKGQINKINRSKTTQLVHSKSYSDYADFSIYGATSLLQDDFDSDGFYRTLSVIFDADIYSYSNNQLAEVYALLYISKNGGTWTHYYTTDNFIIEGDSDLDEYEVITTFLSGYSPDYYDILIDLYQVGYSDIVASYSSDDNNALYALPVESADYDEPYIEVIEVIAVSAGSMSMLILLLLSIYFIKIKIRAM